MNALHWSPAHTLHSPHGDGRAGGVALVIHGLNYRPERMQPLVDCLNEAGYDCLCLSLHGHGDNYARRPGIDEDTARLYSFTRVTFDLWRDEAAAAYSVARQRADMLGLPLLLTGFSLGGLVGCTLIATRSDVRVERLLLFAPALAMPPRGFLPWLAVHLPRHVLPSIAPLRYRANRGTPGAGYAALYAGLAALRSGDLQRLNLPALVFCDHMDEAISCAGVESIAAQLPAWTCYRVHKSNGTNGRVFHHLVIGERAVGEDAWRDITERIAAFLESAEQSVQ